MSLAIKPEILSSNVEILSQPSNSYAGAMDERNKSIWDQMEYITVDQALDEWLKKLGNEKTRKNYRSAFKGKQNSLVSNGIINLNCSLKSFALVSHRTIIYDIKHKLNGSECTKQARAAAYISFTRYLDGVLDGNFKRALPCKDGTIETTKTFEKVHTEVVTQAMTPQQWKPFFDELHKLNPRDCLIAKLQLQGAKRINEVLSVTVDQINFDTGEINFLQSKTKGKRKVTTITYPASIMNELKTYISSRNVDESPSDNLVFRTRNGAQISPVQVQNTYAQAGVAANIPFKVHPHVLRASAITEYKRLGYADSDIAKISGHADLEMLNAYDKSSRADNATKRISLVA